MKQARPQPLDLNPEPVSTAVLRTAVQTWLRWSAQAGFAPVVASAFVRTLVGRECDRHERGQL